MKEWDEGPAVNGSSKHMYVARYISLSLSLSFSLSLTHKHTNSLSLSFTLFFSQTHTHTHTLPQTDRGRHALTRTHMHTHSHSFFLCFTLFLSLLASSSPPHPPFSAIPHRCGRVGGRTAKYFSELPYDCDIMWTTLAIQLWLFEQWTFDTLLRFSFGKKELRGPDYFHPTPPPFPIAFCCRRLRHTANKK